MILQTDPALFVSLMIGVLVFIIECFVIIWWEEHKEEKKAIRRLERLDGSRVNVVRTKVKKVG